MVKFANAISRITCRDLVTNTPYNKQSNKD